MVYRGLMEVDQAHAIGTLSQGALKAYAVSIDTQQKNRVERLLEEYRNRPADNRDADSMLRFAPDDDQAPGLSTKKP
jgi:hypothetical protein